MKTKFKNYLIIISLLIVLVTSNLFLCYSFNITAKAESDGTHFCNTQLYAFDTESERINYTKREDEKIETVKGVPLYYSAANLHNSCGATAGAILVGFYDKYYEDLIPNYTSYFTATGKYRPNDKVYVPALMEELYTLMKTNVDDVGVGESDCLNGLSTYVKNKNHLINYSSIRSNSKLNTSAYITSINSNKPVIIFSKSVEVISSIGIYSDHDLISKITISDNHVYVGYGYYTVNYYSGNNVYRTDTYLIVACGMAGVTNGFIKISSTASTISNDWFVNAYSVSIT